MKRRRQARNEHKAGLWSTVTTAVEGGWGATFRLALLISVGLGACALLAWAGVNGGGLIAVLLRS